MFKINALGKIKFSFTHNGGEKKKINFMKSIFFFYGPTNIILNFDFII